MDLMNTGTISTLSGNLLLCFAPSFTYICYFLCLFFDFLCGSGRYAQFAIQLNSQGYGVFGMDWIGHGGSDGLHGYVQALDHVVSDVKEYYRRVAAEYPGIPCFLFGHSTGGAIALKVLIIFYTP
jgi:pimeloyl-ACP methyl ester carboxylesterase